MGCRRHQLPTVARCAILWLVATSLPSLSYPQPLTCHPVRRGESAAELSRRLTGRSANAYESWFQLRDPAARVVPKSQYDRIGSGWRACLLEEVVAERPAAPEPAILDVVHRAGEDPPLSADILDVVGPDDLALLWLANARDLIGRTGVDPDTVWLGATVILALVGWMGLDSYVGRRRGMLIVMRHFADRFVREFERPLILQPAEPPLRTRLRLSPTRAQLEILLAPAPGRRYPNLADHRKNVEYDIVRVLRSVADDSFVPDRVYSRAGWVVVPFRFDPARKPTGVACISSF